VCHWKTLAEIRLAYVGQLERNVNELKDQIMNKPTNDGINDGGPAYPMGWGAQQRIDELTQELNSANELIIRLQNVTNNPHALWVNWVRGDVKLPEGIGDVREHQDHIRRLEYAGGLALGYASKGDFESADEVWSKAKEVKP
jgi:hypothetical protein